MRLLVGTEARSSLYIDAGYNGSALADYAPDIINLYRLKEQKSQLAYGYMSMQAEIDEKLRTVLVDWLIKAHMQYKLEQETLYLPINIIDRFLSKETVPFVELKLLGFTALFLACKYEEEIPIEVTDNVWTAWRKDYLKLSESRFTPQQVYALEEKILRKLEWNLTVTTPYHSIHHYLKACTKADAKMKNMVCFLIEIALTHYDTIKCYPSMIAASAVYVAQRTLHQKPKWSETLELYTGYSKKQLSDCVRLIEKLYKMPPRKDLPKAIHGKYSVPARDRFSLLPPVGSGHQHFHFKWDFTPKEIVSDKI